MAEDTFAGSLDELRDRLFELWDLTGAGAKPGWLTREDFLPEARIPEGWRPSAPPGDVEWITAADNFAQVLNGWRWLLKSKVWRGVPGVSPAVLWEMIDSAAGLQRFGAGTAANGGDFDSAVAGLAEGMRRAEAIVGEKASELVAAIKVGATPRDQRHRTDEPDEDEIAMARQVCKANPTITRETLRLQMAIGPAKAGKIIDILRDEGLHQSRKRKSREKGD